MIEITQREMDRAYRDHSRASKTLTADSFSRLTCLFYAAECGLKSVLMKRGQRVTTKDVEKYGHNLNSMLDEVKCGDRLRLPDNISLEPLRYPHNRQRNADQGELNQIWRYGVKFNDPTHQDDVVSKLENICLWVKQELRG